MKIEEKYTRVGERGQIVIPKSMRETLAIKPKQIVKVMSEPEQIVIRKVMSRKSPEDTIFEILTKSGLTSKDWKRIHKEREIR